MILWKKQPILVLDTETTGLNPTENRIIEIAWCGYQDGRIIGEGEFLLNPGCLLSPFIINLTGIKDEDLANEPRFVEIVPVLAELFKEYSVFSGYNAIGFDRHFITAELIRSGAVDLISNLYKLNWLDQLVWVRQFQKFEKGKRLHQAAERLGIFPEGQAHRAMSDTKVTMRMMAYYLHRLPDDLDEMLALQSQWSQEHDNHYGEWRSKREEIVEEG